MPTRIVTYVHRPKRAPRKRKAVPAGPAIERMRAPKPVTTPSVANDDRKPGIVTIRRKSRFGEVPDMTPEEHQRRGEAADELFRAIVWKISPE